MSEIRPPLPPFTRETNAIDESDQFGDIDTSDLFTEVSRGIDYRLWLVELHREL